MYLAPLCVSGLGWRWFLTSAFSRCHCTRRVSVGSMAGRIRAFFTDRSLSLLLSPISEPGAPLCVHPITIALRPMLHFCLTLPWWVIA